MLLNILGFLLMNGFKSCHEIKGNINPFPQNNGETYIK